MVHAVDRRAFIRAGISVLALGAAGCTLRGEPGMVDERDIGFDLWTGVPGTAFGVPVDVTRGSRRIHGPLAWTHPASGERLEVYELRNREPQGDKRQLYRLSADGSALGRVFDSRPGRPDRLFLGDAFFPLGRWSRGERRSYPMVEIEGGARREYVATIHIRRLAHEYRGVPGSLTYDWILTDAQGRKVFDERFVYSPGAGFVKFTNRLA